MLHSLLIRRHLEKDEKLLMLVHQHWILGMGFLFFPTLAFAASWVVFYEAQHRMILYLALFVSAASALWWLRNFLDYYLDAWLITDRGVIDVEWQGLFRRKSTRILHSDIQGVSYEVQGILGTLFRYGTLSIEKISTGSAISIDYVRNPRMVEACILHAMEDYMQKKNLKNSKHVQEILSTFVAEQVQLQDIKISKKPDEKKAKGFVTKGV